MAAVTRIPPSTEDHRTRDPELLAADITYTEIIETGYETGHLEHEKWTVSCQYMAKPQHMKPHILTVWSPCCGKPRQRLGHGYAFSCPVCGWWWRYHYCTDGTDRLVSLGKERPQ